MRDPPHNYAGGVACSSVWCFSTVSGSSRSLSQMRSTAGYAAAIGSASSAPDHAAQLRPDGKRDQHRKVRQPQLRAVDLRRDEIVLDEVIRDVQADDEHRRGR